jgi:K+-sensing histidine kinase KdpD
LKEFGMLQNKLGINKKQSDALTVITAIFIIAILLLISKMVLGNSGDFTNIRMFGYQFTASATEVQIGIPDDEALTTVPVNEENSHGLESLSKIINQADSRWLAVLRSSIILLYLLAILIIIFKNRDTHVQGLAKGFLIGVSILLLLNILQAILDVETLLVSFGHDYTHLFYHLSF